MNLTKRKILIVFLLFTIFGLVLGLHIIKTNEEYYWYSKEITYNNVTVKEFYWEDPEWFGIDININFLYDLVLYSILGLIIAVALLAVSEHTKNIK